MVVWEVLIRPGKDIEVSDKCASAMIAHDKLMDVRERGHKYQKAGMPQLIHIQHDTQICFYMDTPLYLIIDEMKALTGRDL